MSINEIKSNFHSLIDEIENEKALSQVYELLKSFLLQKKGVDFWDLFTDEQKKELELAWEDSEHAANLTGNNTVISQAREWIKK
ncbi:MAG: hypothetical protein QME58_12370 [Bacteroidota bacterium]|nr:hypothetical protein [Bacteroidota bacterium]